MRSEFSKFVMKRTYYMKGMAALALALAVVGCSKKDAYDPDAKKQESATNFINNVLGGRAVDGNQTWSTSDQVTVTVNTELGGTLKIYPANPSGNRTAPLITQSIGTGTVQLSIGKPRDVSVLYASLTQGDGSIRLMQVGNDMNVTFKAPTAAARMANTKRKVVKHNIEFPDAPADAEFVTTLPAVSFLTPSQYDPNNINNYILDETANTQELNFYNGKFNLYITGTKNIKWTNPADAADDMYFYVLPGANLTFKENKFTKNGGERFKMYVASGATVTFEKGMSSCIHLYNRGTVIVQGDDYNGNGIYGNGIIYNEGTMKFEGTATRDQVVNPPYGHANVSSALGIWNGAGRFVNAGTLESKGLLVEGSGKFLNLGTANISGYTIVNSNQAVWINDGQYTTDNYSYSAGSQNVWNNCRMTVNDLFAIWLGDSDVNAFQMDANASVVTKDLKMEGPSRIIMGANSLLKVTDTAYMNCRKANYGIYGPSTGTAWAVLQAKTIINNNNSWEGLIYEISYGGNLYVAADSHFANGWNGQYPWYEQGTAKMYNGQNAAPYTIKAGTCNPGYNDNGSPVQPDPEPTMYYYYAFEDLGTIDDFDFNDAIVRVSAPVNGQSTVQLVAAGGTLEAYITYGTEEKPAQLGGEIHATLGSNTTSTMINTSGVDASKFTTIGTIDVAGRDMGNLPFGIKVIGNNGEVVKVVKSVEGNGKAPLVIVVTGNEQGKWFWATERTNITVAYSQFGEWGANAGTNLDWYRTPTGAVVSY